MRSESASHRYGEHRIYLSLAPGIGCTRRLMADAQLLAAQGYDVGIAFNASSDYLCDFARGLRPLPLIYERQNNQRIEALDLETILRDPPQIIVLGNLAHQHGLPDQPIEPLKLVEQLRMAGIAVWSTIYAYNLTTIAPIFTRLTDITPTPIIPETALEQASELVLIDPEPIDIIRQLDEGILLAPPEAEQARSTSLRLDVLNQLRAATHALLEIRRPLSDSAERPRWLVGIGFNPSAMYLLQRAADLAYGMGALLIGVHIRPPGGGSSGYRLAAREHLDYAEELCHEVVIIEEKDVAAAMLQVAHEQHATGIFIGRPVRSRWDELRGGSLLTKLINSDRDLDIFVLADAPR
ncbi:universal stress protein [Herpetosiphon giganteus]|uniref:universal stress protein n=1 Tax=Herpetosiphon giganteus TaxID=2029754 RepID=UPI0019589D2A|nr:universal stress protein [Herpetosiphon giganteus]MBM7844966.1 two-component system sensor histidine kinase KdpD [Herpetosiphon giganteus]